MGNSRGFNFNFLGDEEGGGISSLRDEEGGGGEGRGRGLMNSSVSTTLRKRHCRRCSSRVLNCRSILLNKMRILCFV
jgi:hypothetical protein